jgi:hypothetical protein
MKLFLVLLFVLLVLQLLSASAQPMSLTAVGQNTAHTPAPDHIALLQKCEVDLEVATVHSINKATEVETLQTQLQTQNEVHARVMSSYAKMLTRARLTWSKKFWGFRSYALEQRKKIRADLGSLLQKCQEDLNVITVKSTMCSTEVETLKAQKELVVEGMARCAIEVDTLKTQNKEYSNSIENLNTELENANKIIAKLKNEKQQTPVEVVKLKEELANARQIIQQLENAQQQIPVNGTSSENSTFQSPDYVCAIQAQMVYCAIIVLHELCKFTQRSYTKNDSALHHVFHSWKKEHGRNFNRKSTIILAFYDRGQLGFYFITWKRLSKRHPRVLLETTGDFQILVETFRAECLQRIRKLRIVLENMWRHYKIEGSLPELAPKDLKIFKDTMLQKINHISKNIEWAYCQFDPCFERILTYLPDLKCVLKFQRRCKKILGIKRFVKDFCHLLPLADARTFISENGLFKTGMRMISTLPSATGDESSPVRPWQARVHTVYPFKVPIVADFIFEELKKARDTREDKRNTKWIIIRFLASVVGLVIWMWLALYYADHVVCDVNDGPDAREFYGVCRVNICGVNDALMYS